MMSVVIFSSKTIQFGNVELPSQSKKRLIGLPQFHQFVGFEPVISTTEQRTALSGGKRAAR